MISCREIRNQNDLDRIVDNRVWGDGYIDWILNYILYNNDELEWLGILKSDKSNKQLINLFIDYLFPILIFL